MARSIRLSVSLTLCWASLICATSPSKKPIDEIISDIAALGGRAEVEDVDRAFGTRGSHQFSVQMEDRRVVCLSYSVGEPFARCYVLLQGDSFRVVEPPPFEVETFVVDGRRCERRKAWKPLDRIHHVIDARSLTPGGIRSSLLRQQPKPSRSNLQPAIPLLAPVLTRDPGSKMYQQLESKYDGRKLSLGENRLAVVNRLGSAYKDLDVLGGRELLFGRETKSASAGLARWPWLAVVLRNDEVVAVLSRDFVDDEAVQAGRPQMPDPVTRPASPD